MIHFGGIDALIHIVWYVKSTLSFLDLCSILVQEFQGLTNSYMFGKASDFTVFLFQLQTVMNVPVIVMVQGLYALKLWRRKSAHKLPPLCRTDSSLVNYRGDWIPRLMVCGGLILKQGRWVLI